MKLLSAFLFLGLAVGPLHAQDPDWVQSWEVAQRARPSALSSHSRIAPANEPGDPLILHGRVFQPDGLAPVKGAIVFAYQTDAKGLYHRAGKLGWRLQGWAVTDAQGAFEFATIRPAPYPARTVPAHLHLTVAGGGVPRQWTDEIRFADDPLISKNELARSSAEGKFGDVRPVRRDGKTQHVEINLRTKGKADF